MYPRMHGDDGWYAFEPEKYSHGAAAVYYWSMDPADLARVPAAGWLAFLQGRDADFPERALRADFETIRRKVEGQRRDTTTPDTRLADDPMKFNPATVETLVNLMLGGLHPGHLGSVLHCRLRYFDPSKRRSGMPDDVAALVEKLSADAVTVILINVNQSEPRTLVAQAGGYAEHQFTRVRVSDQDLPLNGPRLTVQLAPGAGAKLEFKMRRYANVPTMAQPWE
jgi:hypothetical protein